MKKNTLIIFIKYPEPGKVKTRLAKDIGEKKAVLLYRKLVEQTITSTQSSAYQQLIFYTPGDKKQQIADWLGPKLTYFPQEGNSLGARLTNAFDLAFAERAERTVIIGSDSPFLDVPLINKAFLNLENKKCVIGPAQDGGYYLLGLSSPPNPEIFRDIEWSTGKVLRQTEQILKETNTSYVFLEEHFDIDTKVDFQKLKVKIDTMKGNNRNDFRDLDEIIKTIEFNL